jgi:hypothetical protein
MLLMNRHISKTMIYWLIKSHSGNASDQWTFSSQDVEISLSLV